MNIFHYFSPRLPKHGRIQVQKKVLTLYVEWMRRENTQVEENIHTPHRKATTLESKPEMSCYQEGNGTVTNLKMQLKHGADIAVMKY